MHARPTPRKWWLRLACTALVLAPVWSLAWPSAAQTDTSTALRLVVRIADRDYDRFSVADERLTVLAADGSPAPMGTRSWRLEGDPKAHASSFTFPTTYRIARRDPLAGPAHDGRGYDAHVLYDSNDIVADFGRSAAVNGLLVVTWIVDGRVDEVVPVPLPNDPDKWSTTGTIIELSTDARRGAPALLLWTPDGFAPSKPVFFDEHANAALAAMYFGTREECVTALAAVPNPLARCRTRSATFIMVAAGCGSAPAIEAMLARKVRIDNAGESWGAVGWATRRGRTDAVDALTRGIPWSRDAGRNMAKYAADSGNLDIAIAQFDRFDGWNSWTTAAEPLAERAAAEGRLDILQRLAHSKLRVALRHVGARALASRIVADDAESVALLLEHGADVRDRFLGRTLLHVAAEHGRGAIARQLIDHKARVDATDGYGRTPLMLAARAGHAEMCRQLLDARARVDATDDDRATALDHATLGGRPDTIQLLADRGARAGAGAQAIQSPAPSSTDPIVNGAQLDRPLVRIAGSDLPKFSMTETGYGGFVPSPAGPVALRKETLVESTIEELVASVIVEPDGFVSWIDLLSEDTRLPIPENLFVDWRFSPPRHDGQPVRTRWVVRISTNVGP